MGSVLSAPFLVPMSWLYGAGASAHRKLYRSGILRARRLPRPVASIGNLAVGGGGKTPLVIHIAQELAERGVKAAVLSRGYGRHDPRSIRIVSRGEGPVVPAALAGDEPFMIARRSRGTWVAVAPRRYDAGMAVLRETPVDLFLLDDGFSHHALARDLDVVTVDARRWFGNGRLLPAGILREPVSRLRDADMIVVTKALEIDQVFENVARGHLAGGGLVGWSSYLPDHLATPEGENELTLDALKKRKVFLFSGIADPLSFEKTAAPLCGAVVGLHRFPD